MYSIPFSSSHRVPFKTQRTSVLFSSSPSCNQHCWLGLRISNTISSPQYPVITSPEPLDHQATWQLIGNLYCLYFWRWSAGRYFRAYAWTQTIVVGWRFGVPNSEANVGRLNPSATVTITICRNGDGTQKWIPWKKIDFVHDTDITFMWK